MGLPTIQLLLGFWRRIAPQFVLWVVSTLKPKDGAKDQHQEKADQQNSSVEFEDAKQKTKGKLIDSRTNLHWISVPPLAASSYSSCFESLLVVWKKLLLWKNPKKSLKLLNKPSRSSSGVEDEKLHTDQRTQSVRSMGGDLAFDWGFFWFAKHSNYAAFARWCW